MELQDSNLKLENSMINPIHLRRLVSIGSTRLVFVLLLLYMTTCSEIPPPGASNPWKTEFNDPPMSYRPLTWWHWISGNITKDGITRDLHNKYGFGGVAPEASRRMGPVFLSDEYIEMYGDILQTAEELGMTVVFYDEAGFPSGQAGGQMAKRYPEHLVKYLARGIVTVEGPADAVIPMPEGKIMSVVAKDIQTSRRRVITSDAQRSEDGSSVIWEAPAGRWDIQAFVCATAPRRFLVDFLDPDAVKKFMGLTYDPLYERFPSHFGTTIHMTFFDDLSTYQAPDDLLWTPLFNEEFQKRFGRSPEALYPALWEDIGSETGPARVSLYGMRNELFAAGYPRVVDEWCKARGIISSGHPANAYRPNPLQSTGDAILFYKYQGAPLTDYIQYPGNGVDGFKIPASAAYNFDRDLVACETFAAFNIEPPDIKTLYRCGTQLYARGINYLLPATRIISHNSVSELLEWNRWAFRCETLLRNGRHVADIAVLYPIDDLEARYVIGMNPGRQSKDPIPGTDYYKLSRLLTGEVKRDFTFLHPEIINERCSIDGDEFVLNNTKHWARFRVVILPACRTIRVENLSKIRDFMRNGGHVIATTCLPEQSAEFGRDAEVQAMSQEIFGPGGKGIFLPTPDDTSLRKALDGMGITWDVRLDNATRIPRVKIDRGPSPIGGEYINGNREFAYIHRSVPGAEMYFFGNSSDLDVEADVTLRGKMTLELWDPHTGTICTLDGTPDNEKGEPVMRFNLKLPAIHSVFVVGRKTK